MSKNKDKEAGFFFFLPRYNCQSQVQTPKHSVQISSLLFLCFYIFPCNTSRRDHLLLCEYIIQVYACKICKWCTVLVSPPLPPHPSPFCQHRTHLSKFRSRPAASFFPFFLSNLDVDFPIAVRSASLVWQLFESVFSYDFLNRKCE